MDPDLIWDKPVSTVQRWLTIRDGIDAAREYKNSSRA